METSDARDAARKSVDGRFSVILHQITHTGSTLAHAPGQRARAAVERRLLDAERLLLTQEVHDVAGHGLAVIQMQADVTLQVHDCEPDRMRATLQTISRVSQDALDELRATLDSIRTEGGQGPPNRASTPGLARAAELCQRVEAAGVQVDLHIEGRPRALPPAADVAAYRVLQEALTNVVKHSTLQHAHVRIAHTAQTVTVEVTNQDFGPAPVEGIGISGMRRRVTRLGGTFCVGLGRQPGTFQVGAVIPRPQEESAP